MVVGEVSPAEAELTLLLVLGCDRIVASEIEAPNILAIRYEANEQWYKATMRPSPTSSATVSLGYEGGRSVMFPHPTLVHMVDHYRRAC